jgi:protein-disulfide isomerase
MSKKFWIILGAIAVVIVGYLLLQGGNQADTQNSDTGTNHVRGNQESSIKLVEYADFQCPFCALFYPAVEQVIDKYENDIAFQQRHLPLPTHQNARAAARAAEAAADQGKFWEMSDLLFGNQQAWSESSNPRELFRQYAQQLGLNVEQFDEAFSSSAVNNRINADIDLFNQTGEQMSTPTFFLNGERLSFDIPDNAEDVNAYLIEQFSTYIDEAIANSKQEQE